MYTSLKKQSNSSSNFNIFSTHLSGDEVQGIVLGSRPLFLSRPSPPGAPLRPHVSSKILYFKNKKKQKQNNVPNNPNLARDLGAASGL